MVAQAGGDKRRDSVLDQLAIVEVVANRVPQKRRHVVFAIGQIRLGVNCEEAVTMTQDVVVVKVPVDDPIGAAAELSEQVASERDKLAALALSPIEPAADGGMNLPVSRAPAEMFGLTTISAS